MLDKNYLKVAPSGKLEVNKKEMLSMCLEKGGHETRFTY